VFTHAKSRATRRSDGRERILVFADHRSAPGGLTHATARGGHRVVLLDRPCEIPGAVDAEVDVQGIARVELEEQVLADRIRANDSSPVDQGSIAESSLRARNSARRPDEMTSELARDAVNGMSLGHG
jgi:hypothetical protein